MAKMKSMHCPVCGMEKDTSVWYETSCQKCGYSYAFIQYAAGNQSLQLLNLKQEAARHDFRRKRISTYAQARAISLTGGSVAFVSTKDKKLTIIHGDGSSETQENVVQYSANDRNSAVLFTSGAFRVSGDNSYGQCDAEETDTAAFVMCAPNSTYIIDRNGKVKAYGAIVDHSYEKWTDIAAMACGSYHILGLTRDGQVKIAGDMIESGIKKEIASWKEVRAVAAATDCSIGLLCDGTVKFAGRADDPRRESVNWKNMEAIQADSSYVVGINADGDVLMAGYSKAFLDMGRKEAGNWKDMLAISCSKSGIAGLSEKGSLQIVGSFSGEKDQVCKVWSEQVKIE
ncbi:MAG: hypothetical protein K5697_08885 [Lachnospiraceae bacterium]|nr:hypothetical protein [Lachnospiraceae bacterium]